MCEAPEAPENGTVSGTDFSFKGVVTFSCDPGYKRIGSSTRKCTSKGWGKLPRCVGKCNYVSVTECLPLLSWNMLGYKVW